MNGTEQIPTFKSPAIIRDSEHSRLPCGFKPDGFFLDLHDLNLHLHNFLNGR